MNSYTKTIHLSLPFLYCIIAYQNVSKRIISILANHIVWITLLHYILLNIQVEIGQLINTLLCFHYLGQLTKFSLFSYFFWSKKVGCNPTFYCFWTKKVTSYEKIRKWKTGFKIRYVNKNFVNFIQTSTASCIWAMKWCWTNYQM